MGTSKQSDQEAAQETGRPDERGRSPGSRRTQFPKGISPNPGGKPKVKPEEADGLGDAARMRRVYEQPAAADRNSAQRVLRRLLDRDIKGYIQLMTGLERSARAAAPAAGSGPGPEPGSEPADEGEERVLALIAELLEEARQGRPPESGA